MKETMENMIQEQANEIAEGIAERDCGKLAKGLIIGGTAVVVTAVGYGCYKLVKFAKKKAAKKAEPEVVADGNFNEIEPETEEKNETKEVKDEQ